MPVKKFGWVVRACGEKAAEDCGDAGGAAGLSATSAKCADSGRDDRFDVVPEVGPSAVLRMTDL